GQRTQRAHRAVQQIDGEESAEVVLRQISAHEERGAQTKDTRARESAVCKRPRWKIDWPERSATGGEIRCELQHAIRNQPTRTAAFVCDASAAGRRRLTRHSGTARACASLDDTAIHSRQRRAVARRLPEGSSQGPEVLGGRNVSPASVDRRGYPPARRRRFLSKLG